MTAPSSSDAAADAETTEILRQLAAASGSISPADVARALQAGLGQPDGRWQARLPAIRQAALALARAGRLEILRHGKPVAPEPPPRGVIRLRRPPSLPSARDESVAQHP